MSAVQHDKRIPRKCFKFAPGLVHVGLADACTVQCDHAIDRALGTRR